MKSARSIWPVVDVDQTPLGYSLLTRFNQPSTVSDKL